MLDIPQLTLAKLAQYVEHLTGNREIPSSYWMQLFCSFFFIPYVIL